MGVYLNPGKETYEDAINSEIFIDKTPMIQYLNTIINTKQKYVSVSRPRRFGKTIAADMICAYYDREADSREMFEKRNLAKCEPVRMGSHDITWDEYLGKFDVIHIVMTDFFKTRVAVDAALDKLVNRILDELDEYYPGVKYDETDITYSFDKFYKKTGRRFVIVIDEWDAVFRVKKEDGEGQVRYLDFLRDWLKDKSYVALAYMTGILPIKKYGKHSALNMFDEYSMMFPMQLAGYTGFTEKEVKQLCDEYGRNFDKIKDWYDGYNVSDIIPPNPQIKDSKSEAKAVHFSLYSPLSVVKAVSTGNIMNYWNKTETYEALAEYIRMDYDGLKDAVALLMEGGRLKIDTSTYQNDMTTFYGRDDVLSLLVHLGYLGYDDIEGEVFIPNKEILDEFKASTKTAEWTGVFRAFEKSKKLLAATWEKDADAVAEFLEDAHNDAENKTYNDEAALSYAVQYAYYAAQMYYTKILELDTGKGYADLAYIPSPKYSDKPALIIELKFGKDTAVAMEQVKKKKYLERLEHYKGNTLVIGINYDKELANTSEGFKRHSCVIEEA